MHSERRARLIERIRALDLDAVALVPGPNLFYLTGLSFHLSERPIVALFPAEGSPTIIVPELEAVKVGRNSGIDVYSYADEDGHEDAVESACEALGLDGAKLGGESCHMRLVEVRLLQRCAPGCRLVAADEVLAELRMRKDQHELAQMRTAIAITEEALKTTMEQVRVGVTERQVSSLLTIEMLRAGGDAMAFSPIVVAGPNAAVPHATPSDRPIQRGETIAIDCGAAIAGYAADITRTFAIGELDPQLVHVYDIVRAANASGRTAVCPGLPAEAVDRAAREVIEEASFGERFIHRTGHGLGLEVHEQPYIVAGNDLPLEPGMTFTVEPGIYLPGRGGVRIEDDVLVTQDGVETLTTFTRDLLVLSE
ncbi:MAG: Xaa-Pro peptidase family protein [Anaerolineae bacterium]|jgi:Xaa-Pro dipeptidase